jgi:hypothetical protein
LLVLKNHAEERINLTELSMKYNLSIKTMEINIREKLLAELSDEKIRYIYVYTYMYMYTTYINIDTGMVVSC